MRIPLDIGMRVGAENGTWAQGKVIVFDDSYEHEIWHMGNKRRIALLLHLEHPFLQGGQPPLVDTTAHGTTAHAEDSARIDLVPKSTAPTSAPPPRSVPAPLSVSTVDDDEHLTDHEDIAAILTSAKIPVSVAEQYSSQLIENGFDTIESLQVRERQLLIPIRAYAVMLGSCYCGLIVFACFCFCF